MKLLLDTHIWLWSRMEPRKLATRVAVALNSGQNELWLSPITIWEVLLLVEKGRVALDIGVADWVERAMQQVPMREAPVTNEVALEVGRVTLPHRDPADRFLAATARVFGLTLVTADEHLIRAPGLTVLANR